MLISKMVRTMPGWLCLCCLFGLMLPVTVTLPTRTQDTEARVQRSQQDDGNGQVETDSQKVVCYFPNWGQYRPGLGKYLVSDIDPFICTHLVYAFARIDGLELGTYEPNDFLMYAQMQELKNQNPSLITMLSVGGATMGNEPFQDVSSTPYTRRHFAVNAAEYARTHGFDGIDIDWEYPGVGDKDNFSELIKALKLHFVEEGLEPGRTQLVLSAAFPANEYRIHNCYDSTTLGMYLDIANIMAYDLHGGWDTVTGHHSALHGFYSGDPFSQEWVINEYISEGMPGNVIMLGIPTYGRTFRLCHPSNHDVRDCSSGHGNPGQYTQTIGSLAYYEICDLLDSGYRREYDSVQQAPYAYRGDQWVGYDDTQSVSAKKRYAQEHSLGGYMIWDLSMDDFGNRCGGGRYPLIKAVRLPSIGDPSTTTTSTTPAPPYSTTTRRVTLTPPTSTPPTHIPSSTTPFPGLECEYSGQFLRDPYDCSVFYQCVDQNPIKFQCAAGLYFDLVTNVCNYPEVVDCTPLDPPQLERAGGGL